MIRPIPFAVLSKAQVCGFSSTGVAVSNPDGGMDVLSLVFVVCCVGRRLCYGPITRPAEPYHVCVLLFDQVQQQHSTHAMG